MKFYEHDMLDVLSDIESKVDFVKFLFCKMLFIVVRLILICAFANGYYA